MNREEVLRIIKQAKQSGKTSLSFLSEKIEILPPEIGQLTDLIFLELRNTSLRELPESIGHLRNLQSLDISHNFLTEIPKSIGQLTNLISLDLRSNQLTEIPESIGNAINLKSLELYSNYLTEVPESIAQLHNLEFLDISSNKLTKLSESIGHLHNLNSLCLNSNQLTEFPKCICQLINLTSLELYSNQLIELPEQISYLTSLKNLDLRSNKLKELPSLIGDLKNLESLTLSRNQLQRLPKLMGQLTSLISLDLRYNQLTELPESISQLNELISLDLRYNKITELPDSIGQINTLASLDLRYNKLTRLPESIGDLVNFDFLGVLHNPLERLPDSISQLNGSTSLDLSAEGLTSLPEWICQLTSLTSLTLLDNYLIELPEWIYKLKELTSLDISYNRLQELPNSISQLKHLLSLNLRNNQLEFLPETIGNFTNLRSLDVRNNQLTELAETTGYLRNLTSLSLSNNQLVEIPSTIGQLKNLSSLDIRDNQLLELPRWIGCLDNLKSLDVRNNKLVKLPDTIGQLANLENLDLTSNKIRKLPRLIGDLIKLRELKVTKNELTELPYHLTNLKSLSTLTISSNKLDLPPEILRKRKPEKILEFLRQQEEEGISYVYEAKLIIIGEGGAGKTTLANKLIDSNYELKLESSKSPEKSTEGIDVVHLNFSHSSGNSFRINIWDFGGQEIYHATHQFFLTKRSLYLLVADTRQDNTDFNWWLEVVELLSEASPALIIRNEKQDRPCQINENQLRGRFKNLKETLATNFLTNRGLPEIVTAVQHHISQLSHIGDPLPKTWVRVRKALEQESNNHISQSKFLEICETQGFKRREDKLQLSSYLHDLGVCLHFQDDPILKNIVILKPTWGTTAVYQVLDTPKVQQNLGCFTHDDLATIWSEEQYTDMRDELLQLMMRFKLCYEIPNQPRTYISPQLLSPNQPDYDWNETDHLILRYKYDFMPKGILTRFIVEMHRLIDSDLVWKEGVIITDGKARAEIIEAYYRGELRIRVSGFLKKSLLERIRHEISKIHDTYNKPEDPPENHRLKFQEFIPCNCKQCKGSQTPYSYPLQRLETRLKNNRHEIECDNSYEMVNVCSLIDDVLGPDSRIQQSQSKNGERQISIHNQYNFDGTNFQNKVEGSNVNQGQTIDIDNHKDNSPKTDE